MADPPEPKRPRRKSDPPARDDSARASDSPTWPVPRPAYWPGRIEDIREFLDPTEVRQKLADLGGWDDLEIEQILGMTGYTYYMVSAIDVLSRRVLLCWDGKLRTVDGELAQAQTPGEHRELPWCQYPGCENRRRELETCANSDGRLACAWHRTYRDEVFVCKMCDEEQAEASARASAEASAAAEARAVRKAQAAREEVSPSRAWPPSGPITTWPVGEDFDGDVRGYVFYPEPGGATVEASGELHCQEALGRIAGGRACDSALNYDAMLLPEPSNRDDANAVRVIVLASETQPTGSGKVGYLSREDAIRYRPVVDRLASIGKVAVCRVHLKGGWNREHGDRPFGVTLYLDTPANLMLELGRVHGRGPLSDWRRRETAKGLIVVGIILVLLYLLDPGILAELPRLLRWFGGGSSGN